MFAHFFLEKLKFNRVLHFRYPLLMPIGNGNINYVQLPIKYGDDVKLMFHVVAQIPPSNTIEMYLQTCPMDHSCRSSIPFNEENATNVIERYWLLLMP